MEVIFYPAFICRVAIYVKTSDRVFMKILPMMYLWPSKSSGAALAEVCALDFCLFSFY